MSAPKPPVGLEPIVRLARAYAAERDALQQIVDTVHDAQRAIVRKHRRSLTAAIARTSGARDELQEAIEVVPQLFVKPRTQTEEGIKFGLRKQPGALRIADETKVIARVRKHFPEREQDLVQVKESVAKAALRKLPATDLARLGVTLEADEDEVTIKAASDALDRLVAALMGDVEEGGA